MGVLDEKHWVDRFGEVNPCNSGDQVSDRLHRSMVRRAYRRAFPLHDHDLLVVDIGCGDGKFSR